MKKTLAILLVLFPVLLEAHPGHGVGIGHEIFHYIISPYHMGLAIILVALIIILIKSSRKKTAGV